MWSPLAINLEYIAAYIESDVNEIMIVNQEFDDTPITHHLKKFKPDFFGVTMSATDHISGLDLCKTAKKYGITTSVGGYHPTAIPDDMLKYSQVDMVFRGESELTMKEFIKQGSPEDIDGISYKNNGTFVHNDKRQPIEDLDSMPFPARHLRVGDECNRWLQRSLGHRDQVHTSRGCWGRCTFCCEPSMSLSFQRYRDPDKVFKEIKEVYKLHDEEDLFILFGDPHLMGKPKLIERLCDLLISENMDINFTAMVRADSIAQNPEIVEKMVKAGIIGYCMGLESPAHSELKGTKKGITNRIQKKAVRILRKNHAVAGGTFIIGLPGQTEEEILTFPEYARNLGMLNAAFAIVTPQAGTEFYQQLDSKNLINVRDWTEYDQMHMVFKHESLSKERLEQLLTHCLGRYYALDIFIDDMIEAQFRNEGGRKITLKGAFSHFLDRVRFVMDAGGQYRPDDGHKFGRIFLKAQINPWTRKRTEKIGLHNMIQLKAFLKAFGNQKLQITLLKGGKPFVHYVLKTTKERVEYLDICEKPHNNATLNLELDLHELRNKRSRILLKMIFNIVKRKELPAFIRGGVALLVDHLNVTKSTRQTHPMALPSDYDDTACAMDGWDEEEYRNLKLNSQNNNHNKN
jgi:radical SAM superfamily enzyme YgiQ (UPF0313 family)